MTPDAVAALLAALPATSVATANACELPSFVGENAAGERWACLTGPEGPRCLRAPAGPPVSPWSVDCGALAGLPPPDWLAPAAALPEGIAPMRGEAPHPAGARPSLTWSERPSGWIERVWLAVPGATGWALTAAPVTTVTYTGRFGTTGMPFDTTALTGEDTTGLRIWTYDGGSGGGGTTTALLLLDRSPRPRERARFIVGWSAWERVLDEDGRKPNLNANIDLEPSVTSRGTLRLKATHDFTDAPGVGIEEGPDPRASLRALAGEWRLVGCALERVSAAKVAPGRVACAPGAWSTPPDAPPAL